jgi:MtrB/PioB family decaheme-associated outer membrane protein
VTDAAGNVRRSLDGDIDTKVINLHADTRPHERLTLRAAYRNDERDNNTPELLVDAGPLVTYTVGFQCAGSTCITRPISFKQERVNAEADWRVTRNTFLTLGYTHDERNRTYEDRETTEEQTVEARLRTRWGGSTLTLNIGSAEQTGSNFERDTLPVLLRKYYLADRDRTIAGAHLALALSPRLQTSFRAQWMSDDYTASELGLTSADRAIFSWDAAYFPTERLQTYAFYSMEVRKADQSGIDGTVPWTADREDNTYSFGVGGEYTMIKDVLKLGIEGTLVETFGKIDVVTATGVGGPYPDLRSTFGLVSLYGDWKLSDRMAVRMRYMYERYEEEDWGINGVGVTGVGDLILLQQSSPDYAAHIVAATLRYRF